MLTLLLTLCLTFDDPQVDPPPFTPAPGARCRLGDKSDKIVIGSLTLSVHQRLVKLVGVGDELGVKELLDTKLAKIIDPSTPALIISITSECGEVRILDGPLKGKAVYVHRSYLKPPPTAKEVEVEEKARQEETRRAEQAKATQEREKQEAMDAMRRKQEETRKSGTDPKKLTAEQLFGKRATESSDKSDESKAAELLKSAKRWLEVEKNEKVARERVEELLRRYPKSEAAREARKLLPVK